MVRGDDIMKVKLVAYTPNPELVCAAAAMASTTPGSIYKVFEEMNLERAQKLIRNVVGRGHVSVIEHASFTFAVEDVSRVTEIHLIRHRIASYTIKSGRYNKTHCDIVIPSTIEKNEKALKKVNEFIGYNTKLVQELLELGIPFEDTRFLSPQGIKTNIVFTMNARELLHFFGLRCCMRSQWEIRELADAMLAEVRKVAPVIFENAGPNCVQLGYCPEGKMKPPECDVASMKEKYRRA